MNHIDQPALSPKQLRANMLAKRDSLPETTRAELSKHIIHNLKSISSYSKAKLPLFYISFRSEVNTWPLIKERLAANLPVAAPISLISKRELDIRLIKNWDTDLHVGAYGILEPVLETTQPVNPTDIDLVLVPGSVFGYNCGRYGYGGGFYDRFLSQKASQAFRIGLSYEIQLAQSLALQPHDQKMDMIVTEKQIISCSSS